MVVFVRQQQLFKNNKQYQYRNITSYTYLLLSLHLRPRVVQKEKVRAYENQLVQRHASLHKIVNEILNDFQKFGINKPAFLRAATFAALGALKYCIIRI
jgi:hypothetical protein